MALEDIDSLNEEINENQEGHIDDHKKIVRGLKGVKSELEGRQSPSPRSIFVHPTLGNDTEDGTTWGKAVQTLSHAATIAPIGGTIEIAAGTVVDVGAGIVLDSAKLLTIKSSRGSLVRRQHDDSSTKSVLITSTVSPASFFQIGSPATSNVFGWTFEGLYFDLGKLADDGAGIMGYGINRTHFLNCGGRALSDRAGKTWFLRTNKGVGDDASWLLFENVVIYGARLADMVSGNYTRFLGANVIGNTSTPLTGPCLRMEYASQSDFTGLNVEGWTTAVSVTGTRGLMGKLVGESNGTILAMNSCYDAVITVNSAAGPGNQIVRDTNGDNNVVIGTVQVIREGNTTRGTQLNSYGMAPVQLAADYMGPIVAPRTGMPATASELMPFGAFDILAPSIPSMEYWDGSTWSATWANTNYRRLMTGLVSGEGITIDATHKRFRYRAGGFFNNINGLLYVSLAKSFGGDSTITVRRLLTDGTVEWSKQLIYKDSAGLRGFQATIPQGGAGATLEIEFDLGLSGSETASLLQVHLFTHNHHPNMPGRWIHGKLTPEGQLGVSRGSVYHAAGYSTDSAEAGLWIKHSNEGVVTGWERVITEGQRIVTKSPDGSLWRINVANDGTLSTTKL